MKKKKTQTASQRLTKKTIPAKPVLSDDSVLSDFHTFISRWFRKTFPAPSPAQEMAWPAIRRGDNTLLLAPTGSGKTLAAFLCSIDDLVRRSEQNDLHDGIHILYISPLKALGNDIHKNLMIPLEGIRAESGGTLADIRVAVRTGDTSQSERERMARKPPHILITTPESLYILLINRRMSEALRSVRTVIIDEIHSMCSNKRGVHLAVSLERLQNLVDHPMQRVGCSATLSPLERIAAFLVGYESPKTRPCTIINAGMRKDFDVQVLAPLPDFLEASNTALWSSAYELLLDEIARHRTTLIFSNSRYKTERTALRMTELAGPSIKIGAHHGSMSKEMRLETEDALKSGKLNALIATSSLELGIDIGSVDIVYQLESPRSVAAGLQRIGRAGHLLHATSKGRMLIFERDELMEAAAISKAMLAGEVDANHIPENCLDVLAQQIAGSVAERPWNADDLYHLIRRSYPYRNLSREDYESVLTMLAGDYPFQMAHAPKPLILWDRASGRISPTRSTLHVAATCAGTIPESSDYEVLISSSNKRVGTVHSEFVDDNLRRGDVFVLGSSAWRVVGVQRNHLLVEDAPGSTPTVPYWLGPVESRTPEVGAAVGNLRREIAGRLSDPALPEWLEREYHLSPYAAAAVIAYVREQRAVAGLVPDEKAILVESWKDELGRMNIIVHSPYGSRINKTWGIAIAAHAKKKYKQDWSVTALNDILLLTHREGPTPSLHKVIASNLLADISPNTVGKLIPAMAEDASDLTSSFRDAAVCAFQILRSQHGKRVAPWLQNHRAGELHEVARQYPEYPVMKEVLREYLVESLNLDGLGVLLSKIDEGKVQLVFRDVESPSPFAHSVLVQDFYKSKGGYQMGRDRRAHLLRLHRQVLQEVLSAEQMAQILDTRAIEKLEKRLLHQSETTRAKTPDELAQVIRDLGDLPATRPSLELVVDNDAESIVVPPSGGKPSPISKRKPGHQKEFVVPALAGEPNPSSSEPSLAPSPQSSKALQMLAQLVKEKRIVAVELPNVEQEPFRLIPTDSWQTYSSAFDKTGSANKAKTGKTGTGSKARTGLAGKTGTGPAIFTAVPVPVFAPDGSIAFRSKPATQCIPAKHRTPIPEEKARLAILERYLRCHGPITQYEIMNYTGWPVGAVENLLNKLVETGTVACGVYTKDKPFPHWINKANLEEVHHLTMGYLKRELAACEPYEVVDFMTRWQHVHPETQLEGIDGLRTIIQQLQGLEVLQAYFEGEILPARIRDYRPEMLDQLVASGEICWRRVGMDRLRRGPISLCIRRDMNWIAASGKPKFDSEREADFDIKDQIIQVRHYFRDNGPAFFHEIVRATGLEEGVVMRAIWYLAWCGEVSCDTYECIRHACFTASLSGCYDLMHIPKRIPLGHDSHERVIERMSRRKLNPALGRWWPTERLCPPNLPLPQNDIARSWAQLLFRRWGIVSKATLQDEVAAPSWGNLLREFKRMELLGQVNRGYFIEGHPGEQYGLPEAIELLRECRARRSDRATLGYLPDEAVFALTNQDPANLYSRQFDAVEERGTHLNLTQAAGNVQHLYIMQAGQVLLFNWRDSVLQLAELTRPQLIQCLKHLPRRVDPLGTHVPIRYWNRHPVEVSPVTELLQEVGICIDKAVLVRNGPEVAKTRSTKSSRQIYLPHYAEEAPVQYDAEWVLAHSQPAIRPKLQELFTFLQKILPAGCGPVFGPKGFLYFYRNHKCISPWVTRKYINLFITHKGWTWPIRVLPDTNLEDPAFLNPLRERIGQTCAAIDLLVEDKHRKEKQ